MKIHGYTVVQHSAAGYKSDDQFAAGLEVRGLNNPAELRMVTRVGGVAFETWEAADNWADAQMYHDDNDSVIPDARGTFASDKIDGLKIYIPPIIYRLTVTDVNGTVIDTIELTRAELRRAQGTAMGALSILQGLSIGKIEGEA